ncbi:MAG: hypothetical protein ACFBSD_10980 [Paracoccaceae bacterium]
MSLDLSPGALSLRPPEQVMRLARLGAMHRTRLSFMPTLLRRLFAGGWRVDRPLWEIDARGVGRAAYRLRGPRSYTLVAFAHDLPPECRSDRVIAEAWDATFALVDGEPDAEDLARLAANVPRQEAGRIGVRELVLSRANRSVRLFGHVRDRLAEGRQPDPAQLAGVGYLMRTTAVYGSGKFGAADRDLWADRAEFAGAFQPEMLAVWLIRAFTLDLVEHMAAAQAPGRAVRLAPALRRRLGVGNSTGLGMAPFLVNHPALLDAWIGARETALARMRARPDASDDERARFSDLLAAAEADAADWHVADPAYAARIAGLRSDLATLRAAWTTKAEAARPWDALYRWVEASLGLEAQERLVSLLIDLAGAAVDDLAATMSADETACFRIDGRMGTAALMAGIARDYPWALHTDFRAAEAAARVWYVSEEKLEPRLGDRSDPGLTAYEQPLATGRDVAALAAVLQTALETSGDMPIADLLLRRPEHRHAVRRVQRAMRRPYAEIRDNLIGAELLPIDLLRAKLAFFGATRFDPRSDRWLRITMFADAPLPDDLGAA